jgi:hypothetical protein
MKTDLAFAELESSSLAAAGTGRWRKKSLENPSSIHHQLVPVAPHLHSFTCGRWTLVLYLHSDNNTVCLSGDESPRNRKEFFFLLN